MFLSNSVLAVSALLNVASAARFFSKHSPGRGDDGSYSSSEFVEEGYTSGPGLCRYMDDAASDQSYSATFTTVTRTVCIVFPSHPRKDSCKALREYPCFISSKCECPRDCTPYTEFGTIGVFYVNIPVRDAKGIFSSDASSSSYKEIQNAIKCTTSYSDFDAMIPFLYNVDLYLGVKSCKFDTTFVTWFINSFHKYIGMRLDSTKYFCLPDGCVMDREGNCKVDLLCASCHGGCSFSDPCKLFNEIIGTTEITSIVVEFITQLLQQIKCACDDVHCKLNCKDFTTYESYRIVLTYTLEYIKRLLEDAHQARKNFLSGKLLTVFATVPYVQSTTAAPAVMTHNRAMFLIDPTAVNFEKLIDF